MCPTGLEHARFLPIIGSLFQQITFYREATPELGMHLPLREEPLRHPLGHLIEYYTLFLVDIKHQIVHNQLLNNTVDHANKPLDFPQEIQDTRKGNSIVVSLKTHRISSINPIDRYRYPQYLPISTRKTFLKNPFLLCGTRKTFLRHPFLLGNSM